MRKVQPDHVWRLPSLEMTADGIAHLPMQALYIVRLGKNGYPKRTGGISAFGGLLDQKHNLAHINLR